MPSRDSQAILHKILGRLKGSDSWSPYECLQADDLIAGVVSGTRAGLTGLANGPWMLLEKRARDDSFSKRALWQEHGQPLDKRSIAVTRNDVIDLLTRKPFKVSVLASCSDWRDLEASWFALKRLDCWNKL